MVACYIGIGANLGDPLRTVHSAVDALGKLPKSQLVQMSPLYESQPMGPQDQPNYINAVARLDTELEPLQLLDFTQQIEQDHGRIRKDERWGARTLDLDILLYGDHCINNERLTVPHYGMRQREFVLYPLHDIYPSYIFDDGCTLSQQLRTVPLNGMKQRSA